MTQNTTYQKILDTARDLIAKRSYNEVSLNMIAKQAGITKPSLYYYFNNKEELFKRILEEMSREFEEKLEHALQQENSATANLHLFIRTYMDFFFTRKNLIQILVHRSFHRDQRICEKIKESRERILSKLEEVMAEVLKEQNKTGDVDPRSASMMVMGMLSPFFVEHIQKEEYMEISAPKVADQVFAFLEIKK